MSIKFNGNNNQHLYLNSRRESKSNQPDEVIEKAIDAGNIAKTPDSEQGKIGAGSWNTQQIKQAGFKLPNEYFIGVYTDWYRFNPETIRRDFPGCDVTTLADLQSVIGRKQANMLGKISEGSWNTKQIEEAGIKLPSKYFIGVYTDYFRFNPDTIRQDFPNKNIMSLADLKAAIDSINTDSKEESSTGIDGLAIAPNTNVTNSNKTKIYTQEDIENFINSYPKHRGLGSWTTYILFIEKNTNPPTYELNTEILKQLFPDKNITTIEELEKAWDGTGLDVKPEIIKNCLDILVKNQTEILKNKGFSDEYVKQILDFLKEYEESMLLSLIDDVESGKAYGTGNYGIFPYLIGFCKGIEELTGSDISFSSVNKNRGINEIDGVPLHSLITHCANESYLSDKDFKNNIQFEFFKKLVSDTIKDLNLTDRELEVFANRILMGIGQRVPKYYGDVTLDDLYHLQPNGLSVFMEVIKEEAAKINKDVDRNPSIINNFAFFNNDEELMNNGYTPEFLLAHLDDMLLSDDGGVRKFAQIIDELISVCDGVTPLDKVRAFIMLLNQGCHIKTDPPVINHQIINIMTERGDIFTQLENLANSNALKNLSMINGKIGNFSQGSTGDCWLLSSLYALSSSEAGAKLIHDAIQWNDDYTEVRVYFKGVNKYVTVTLDEILNATNLSSGDKDAVVIELAMQKLYGDINGDWPSTFWSRFVGDNTLTIKGGSKRYNTLSDSNICKWLEMLSQMHFYGVNFAATMMIGSDGEIARTCKTVDGQTFTYNHPNEGHAFAITNINKVFLPNGETDYENSTITFVNPWDTENKVYTVSWSELRSLGVWAFECVTF